MVIYAKRFRNRIGCFTLCSSPSDLMTQFGGQLRPTDLDALCLGSGHASSGPFADFRDLTALCYICRSRRGGWCDRVAGAVFAGPHHPLARVAASKQVLQIADMKAEPLYLEKNPSFIAMVDMAGARTLFVVPIEGQQIAWRNYHLPAGSAAVQWHQRFGRDPAA